jgi:hypothetical protein
MMSNKLKAFLGTSTVALLPIASNVHAMLVEKAGISEAVAFAVISVLSSGGVYAASLAWPVLAPFLASAKVMMAIFGTAAVVAF